jgi:hypothetical protein
MSDKVIKDKEAVEAMIKRENQMIAEGKQLPKRVKEKEDQGDKKQSDYPKFFKYFVMLDENRKELAKFANFDGTRLREGKVKDELKGISYAFLDSKYEIDELTPLMSKLDGHQWMAYINEKEWAMFLLFPKDCRRSDVNMFMQELNKFIKKMEEDMGKSEDEIKREFKDLMRAYLKMKSQKKGTGDKFDELDEKIKKIDRRVNHHMKGVTSNMNTAHATGLLAEELKKESAKIKAQAEELADLTGGCDMMTIIMIVVGALLLIAVFGNLYVQMNQPPPKNKLTSSGFTGKLFLNSEKYLSKAKDFIVKEYYNTKDILSRRDNRIAKGLSPIKPKTEHKGKTLKQIRREEKKRIKNQFGDIIRRNKYFKIKNYIKGKDVKPLVRMHVPHISSFIGTSPDSKLRLLI